MSSDPAAVYAEIDQRGKPQVTVPDGPVTELIIIDDIEGAGAEVKPGATVTVHYIGFGQQSNKQFDASWDRGETISFGLNQVIKGWTDGLVGMKEGGRRTLHIPGEQAYGPNPPTPAIAPNETLVFIIDLVETT
jgi:peptidylprolyl isomerase